MKKIVLKDTVETRVVYPVKDGVPPKVISGTGREVVRTPVERDGAEDEYHCVWKFQNGTIAEVPDYTANELIKLGYAEAAE